MVRSTAALSKVRFRGYCLALPCLIVFAPLGEAQTFSGAGDGSLASPYVITDVTQLQQMNLNLSAHYILGNDIDASETEAWNGGMGFEPIGGDQDSTDPGFQGDRFSGSLNGNGYRIHDLYIDRPSEEYVGLFGATAQSLLKNFSLSNTRVHGESRVGGLIGRLAGGRVENCHVFGKITAYSSVGGLAAWNSGGTISFCSAQGEVSGTIGEFPAGTYVGGLLGGNGDRGHVDRCFTECLVSGSLLVGGLVGSNAQGLIGPNTGGVITNCVAAGKVMGTGAGFGGLVGRNYYSTVENCFARVEVVGDYQVGGLAGLNQGWISNCYAKGKITGGFRTGGLIGEYGLGSVSNCHSTGPVTGDGFVGGLIGDNIQQSPVIECYWDSEISGMSVSDGGEGKTTAEMFQMGAFEGWDFDAVWWIDEGNDYPRLRWELGDPKGLLRMIEDFLDGRESGRSFLHYSRHWKGGLGW